MKATIKAVREAVKDLSLHLEGAVLSHVEAPDKLFTKAVRMTIPVEDKPNHYLAVTLTGVEFVKLEGLQ